MGKALLLSAAYSWFIVLLVMMIVMAALFIAIAVAALKPIKIEGEQNGVSGVKRLLQNREAELTVELLSKQKDDVAKDEILAKLRDVSAAQKIIDELTDTENAMPVRGLGVDPTLTPEEAERLEYGEKPSIEQTFDETAADSDGLKKSFSAKLIQAHDEVKVWYFELKNCILCYEKTKARMGWNNEKFYIGRNNVATLTIRGRTLCLYLAVNAEEYPSYPVKKSTSDVYKDVTPCLFRIKNANNVRQAKDLIALLMSDYGVMYLTTNHSIYAIPYEDDDTLIARGLVKKVDNE